MDSKRDEAMAAAKSAQQSIFKLGKERTDAMLSMQKELLDAYNQASRDWLTRVKSEVELWSRFAAKLAETRSVQDAMQLYQECISQRMKMAADDAQRLSDECGSMIQRINRSMTHGGSTGSARREAAMSWVRDRERLTSHSRSSGGAGLNKFIEIKIGRWSPDGEKSLPTNYGGRRLPEFALRHRWI
jgi:hypothetical protein